MIRVRIADRSGWLGLRRNAGFVILCLGSTSGAVAVLAGREIVHGHQAIVSLTMVAAAFVAWSLARPEHATLGLLAVLPFMVYAASAGGFSLFGAVPLIGLVSLILLLEQHGSAVRLRWRLSLPAFLTLFVFAALATARASSISTSGSRLVYLALYAVFAWALASTITAGRVSTRAVATAVVIGASIASIALVIQVVAQFAVGREHILTWLIGEFHLFAGQRAAGIAQQQQNWVVGSLNVVRGIFPFMAAPSAGQYTMLGLVAAVWLWRTRPPGVTPGQRWLLGLAVVLTAAGLLMTLSRQSYVGAFVGVGALTLRREPVRAVIVVALVFLFLAVTPVPGGHSTFGDYLLSASNTRTTSSATRLGLLSQAVHLIPGHWLVGVGPGLYGTLNPDPHNPVYYAHNVWLDETVELGVGGGLALIGVFVLAMRSAFRRRATLGFSMLAAFVVTNLFDDVLYFPRNGILLAVAFALAASGDGTEPAASGDETEAAAVQTLTCSR